MGQDLPDAGTNAPALPWRWYRDYWIGPGFRYSQSMCRIAVGLALLGILQGMTQPDWADYLGSVNRELYRPIGILHVLGKHLPPAPFFAACQAVAAVAVWCVIAGFCTRIAFVLCTVSMMFLAALPWCFVHTWCHAHNIVLLAAIAMMFGGPGPISADALLRRLFSRGARPDDGSNLRWPVLLGQFAVATMYMNAAFWKLNQPGGPPAVWALSDNLHNLLVMQYWALDQPLPGFVEYIVRHEWLYKGLALGNLVNQFLPVLACFLIRRPVLRAVAGLSFVVEIFAIRNLLGPCLVQWYLLYAFFVDWDRLFAWLGSRVASLRRAKETAGDVGAEAVVAAGEPVPATSHAPKYALAWVTLYVGVYLAVAFGSKKQHHVTFPFSPFPMYCDVFAEKPYSQHRPYYLYGARWDIEADPPLPPAAYTWLQQGYYSLPWFSDFDKCFPDRVTHIKRQLEHIWGTSISRLCLSKAIYEIPPFPEYAVRECRQGCTYVLENGTATSVGTQCGWDDGAKKFFVEVRHSGFRRPRFRVGYALDYVKKFRELRGEWKGERFLFDKAEPGPYLIGVWVRDDVLGDEERLYLGDCLRLGDGSRAAYAGTRPSEAELRRVKHRAHAS